MAGPCSLADDAGLGDPRYNIYRTWALAPASSENPFKITTFLPEGYLFHVIEWDAATLGENSYSLVLTQDGVEALVYSLAISELTFKQAVGNHELIFNSTYRLCKAPYCKKNSDNTWEISRSDAFKIINTVTPETEDALPTEGSLLAEDSLPASRSIDTSMVKIRANRRGEVINGYLSGYELSELTASGVITRTDRLLPRYRITKRRSQALSTSCGEERASSDVIELVQNDIVSKRLATLLRMGTVEETEQGKSIELDKPYGASEYKYKFYLYDIEDRSVAQDSDARFFQAAAGFKVNCTFNEGAKITTEDYIEHMIFVNSRNQLNGQPILVDIPSRLFNTPRDIRQYTADAYMISINKPEHFEQAIEILSNKIGDRTLAGYMLTELNRSCRSQLRIQYSGSVCRIYDY